MKTKRAQLIDRGVLTCMDDLMAHEYTGLSETHVAEVTLEGSLARVDALVLHQMIAELESFATEVAHVVLRFRVQIHMSFQVYLTSKVHFNEASYDHIQSVMYDSVR